MVTQSSCPRSPQAEWRFTFPGWDEAGDPDKHLGCQLRLWRGVFQQHQWACQGLHSPPACQGSKVRSHFWLHVCPNEETPAMWKIPMSYSWIVFLCRKRMTIDDSLGHPWIKVSPLFPGCSSALSRSPNEQRNENTNCSAAVVRRWRVQNHTRPRCHWWLGWCTVDDSTSPTEIFRPYLWNCQNCVIGYSLLESPTLALPGAVSQWVVGPT